MIEFLAGIDRSVFYFINVTISNPVSDAVWPLITNYDRFWPVRVVLLGVWLYLLIRGGSRGRAAALLLIPVLFAADKLSSAVIKELVARARPCHEIGGVPVLPGIHLLVDCGPGKSFPSSHAVNNFAVATLFSSYYPRWKYGLFGWAALVALSRPAVGVHYPSDILGGAVIGTLVALLIIFCWRWFERKFQESFTGSPHEQAEES